MLLDKECTACGKGRSVKSLQYHPKTFEAYCDSPYVCNDSHPNSIANVIVRKTEIELLPYEEAVEKYERMLDREYDPKTVMQIRKLLTGPISVRLLSKDVAEYVAKIQTTYNLKTPSEAIRYCVQLAMGAVNQEPQDVEPEEAEPEAETTENSEEEWQF